MTITDSEDREVSMKWEFKPSDIMQFVLVLASIAGFFYNADYRLRLLEKEVSQIKIEYVRMETFKSEMDHIKGTLQEIKAAVIR